MCDVTNGSRNRPLTARIQEINESGQFLLTKGSIAKYSSPTKPAWKLAQLSANNSMENSPRFGRWVATNPQLAMLAANSTTVTREAAFWSPRPRRTLRQATIGAATSSVTTKAANPAKPPIARTDRSDHDEGATTGSSPGPRIVKKTDRPGRVPGNSWPPPGSGGGRTIGEGDGSLVVAFG